MRAQHTPRSNNGAANVAPPTPIGPGLRGFLETMAEEVEAALEHDPAARTRLEVILTYPGLHAIWLHRVAHGLHRRGLKTTARVLSHLNRFVTGVEIHPAARLGRGIFIDHGMGVVVGETATVGDECVIYKGVVLGGTSLERTRRHPTLGRGVVVGTNACILGAISVGDGAKVGSGSVVIRDVPDHTTVVGVPGRLVREPGRREPSEQLDHANLPDPVVDLLRDLSQRVEDLTQRLVAVEGGQPDAGGGGRSAASEAESEAQPGGEAAGPSPGRRRKRA